MTRKWLRRNLGVIMYTLFYRPCLLPETYLRIRKVLKSLTQTVIRVLPENIRRLEMLKPRKWLLTYARNRLSELCDEREIMSNQFERFVFFRLS